MGVINLPDDKTFSSIYMGEELKSKLKKLAARENRSLNSYINIILEKHADNKKIPAKPTLVKKNKLILKRRLA